MSTFPTSLTDKTTLVAWDKVLGYDSETPSNKNFSADAIANFAFTSKTSDNLSEWATNKYASTANVDAAWAVMNSDTSTAGMSFVIDEDNMVSDSATKVPTQQSVKAYVDAEIAGMSLPVADETTAWIVERATDAEALAWVDTTRYINSLQLKTSSTIGNTMTTYTQSSAWNTAFTTSKQVSSNALVNILIDFTTWNSPSSASGWIQTSTDNSNWTTKIETTFTWNNTSFSRELSHFVAYWLYVRWYVQSNSWDTASCTLIIQDNW